MSFPFVYSQQVEISTSTGEQNLDIEIPKRFEFYYPVEFFEVPDVEYEDISVPYSKYVSAELEKLVIDHKMFVKNEKFKHELSLYTGDCNLITVDINNVSSNSIFKNYAKYSRIPVMDNNMYNEFCCNFEYNYIYNTLVIGGGLNLLNKYVTKFVNQYGLNFVFKKILFNKIELFYTPEVLLFRNTTTEDKLFLSNFLGVNIIINKTLISCGAKLFDFDTHIKRMFNINFAIENFILQNLRISLGCDYDNTNNELYYTSEVRKKFGMVDFVILKNKSILHDFVYNYLVNLPQVEYNTFHPFPEKNLFSIVLTVPKEKFFIQLSFDKQNIKNWPTYIFENNLVKTYFLNNVESMSVVFNTKFKIFKNTVVEYFLNYILSENEILFLPKLNSSINCSLTILPHVEFLFKLLYKSKTKIFESIYDKIYLEPQLVSQIEIRYHIKENINIGVFTSFPLINKNFLQPDIYVQPYISAGINIKF